MNFRWLFAGMLLLQGLTSCRFHSQNNTADLKDRPAALVIKSKPQQAPTDTICIVAVGDIMLGTTYPNTSTLPPDSAVHSFDAAKPYLLKADVAIANLEGTLLNDGEPADYKTKFLTKPYLFRMPVKYAGVIKAAGFNVLCLANNHIDDFALKGRQSTVQVLDSLGIKHGGLLKHPTAKFTKNGIKYGFCAFAPNSTTLALLDLKKAKAIVADLKSRCDIVIVSFHGGGEGAGFEHIPFADELFVGENRGNVNKFAHAVIDAGADMVFGHGPHVSRAMELYKNRLIAYSLGNFCTYRCVSVEGVNGLAPLLKIKVNKQGEFLNGRIIAFKQTHAGGLMRDTGNRVIARIKYLTQADFPQSGLDIAADGTVKPIRQKPLLAAQ